MPAKRTKKKSRCAVALGRKGGKASALSKAKKKAARRRTSKKRAAKPKQSFLGLF
jgi:hypothetical protein